LRHIVQQAQHRVDIGVHRHHCLHSQFVAELSSQIARESGYVSPDEAYSAGLLHDIGLLWLIEYADDYLQMLVDIPDERTLTASELERFNEDHAEISSILASRCGLPAGISDAIALHQAEAASLVTAHPWFALLPPPKNLPTTGRPRRRSASRTPAASPGWMDRFSSACWPTPPARFRIELAPRSSGRDRDALAPGALRATLPPVREVSTPASPAPHSAPLPEAVSAGAARPGRTSASPPGFCSGLMPRCCSSNP
jgi:putative nucleotidyltransferase with HDIG domain